MRRLAVASLALLALAGTADAAPRRVCRLLGAGTSADTDVEPDLKIASADIASNAKYLTTVIRLTTWDDPRSAVTGREFEFYFSRDVERSYVLTGRVFGTTAGPFRLRSSEAAFDPANEGDGATAGTRHELARATVVVDAAKKEIRASVPMSSIRHLPLKAGTRLTYLGAAVWRVYGPDRDTTPGHPGVVPTTLTYRANWVGGGTRVSYAMGTPSCVTPGR